MDDDAHAQEGQGLLRNKDVAAYWLYTYLARALPDAPPTTLRSRIQLRALHCLTRAGGAGGALVAKRRRVQRPHAAT